MDVISKVTEIDVGAFDQLLLAIRRLEKNKGERVSPNDVRNLKLVSQKLIQAKLDALQLLERYEESVSKREEETREHCKKLEKVLVELRERESTNAASDSGRKVDHLAEKVSDLEEELELKNEECEYLRNSNAQLQKSKSKGDDGDSTLRQKLEDTTAEFEALQSMFKDAKAKHEIQIEELSQRHEAEESQRTQLKIEAIRKEYESQINELVLEGQQAELEEDEERAMLQAEISEKGNELSEKADSLENLRKELSFLKSESEVKGKLVEKLRSENEKLNNKYIQQSSRARELTEELTTAHDQRHEEKQHLSKEVQILQGRLSVFSAAKAAKQQQQAETFTFPRVKGEFVDDEIVEEEDEKAAAPVEQESREEEEDSSSSGSDDAADNDNVLQERLVESNAGARLLAPLSPEENSSTTPIHEALRDKVQKAAATSTTTTSKEEEEEESGAEYVEIFYDGKWWKARVNDKNEETKRMSVVFGPNGTELIQWVPFQSLRIRPVATDAGGDSQQEEKPTQRESSLSMDQFFMANEGSAEEEEEEEGRDQVTPYQVEGLEKKKKTKKRFKAFRRFSSMGSSSSRAPPSSDKQKRNRFMSFA